MAKIYSAPDSIKVPALFNSEGLFDREKYHKEEENYLKQLKDFVLARKKGKNVGEIISFTVADGKAMYMVASMKPLELVHIPLVDAYEYHYIHRLTAKDVQSEIDGAKILQGIFQ